VTIFIIQLLNSFFYAAVLFLIAAGLSLIYGVMRTSAAATSTPALGPTFAIFLVLYAALGLTLARLLLLLAQRERRRAAIGGTRPRP